jgi:hypothetical protein
MKKTNHLILIQLLIPLGFPYSNSTKIDRLFDRKQKMVRKVCTLIILKNSKKIFIFYKLSRCKM